MRFESMDQCSGISNLISPAGGSIDKTRIAGDLNSSIGTFLQEAQQHQQAHHHRNFSQNQQTEQIQRKSLQAHLSTALQQKIRNEYRKPFPFGT